jgi:hypothetical protein
MALVKICPTCGFGNVPTSPFCSECGVSLVAIAPSEPAEPTPGQFQLKSCDVGTRACPDCKAENETGVERCVYCDCAMSSTEHGAELCHIELVWPWGTERLKQSLRIGREPPATETLIKAINAHGYDNISRSHADLYQDSVTGEVTVVDLGSANGTFIEGIRIPPNKPTALKNGTVVRFAANLSVVIHIHLPE